jgi:hypothetical protein
LCKKQSGTDWNVPYIIYLPPYNMLYCGVPKAGTTTWVEGKVTIFKKYSLMATSWNWLSNYKWKINKT